MPDHAPRHDQPLQSTTAQGSWANIGGGGNEAWPAPAAPSSGAGGVGSGYVSHANVVLDPHKSLAFAVLLAVVFGPLGLFYVGILHGLVALFTVIPIARTVGLNIAVALGGRIDPLYVVVPVMWCITVPWALVGTAWRNQKLKR